jgi:hypothetical protein
MKEDCQPNYCSIIEPPYEASKVIFQHDIEVCTDKVIGNLLEHSYHFMGPINTCFGGFPIACSFHAMLSNHVHHLQMSGQN